MPAGEASNEQPKADVRGLESLVKNLISQQASNRLRPGGNVQPPRAPSTQPPVNTAAATSQVRQPIVPPAQPIPARGALESLTFLNMHAPTGQLCVQRLMLCAHYSLEWVKGEMTSTSFAGI